MTKILNINALMTKILNTVVDDLDRDELPWTYRSHTHYNKAILGDKRPSPPKKEEENDKRIKKKKSWGKRPKPPETFATHLHILFFI